MKRILLLTSFFTAFVLTQGSIHSAGFSFDSLGKSLESGIKSVGESLESGLESAEKIFSDMTDPEDLSPNIMRRVNAANQYLDKAEEQIRTDRLEHAPNQLAGARKEYNNILTYYKGSFDPNHPVLTKLKARINQIEITLSAPRAPVVAPLAEAKPTGQSSLDSSGSSSPAPTPVESNSRVVADLPRDIGEQLVSIAGSIRTLELRLTTAAESNNPGSYVAGVKSDLEISMDKFEDFNQTYMGKFDADHIAYLQVKRRLQDSKIAVSQLEDKAKSIEEAGNASRASAYSAEAQKIMQKYNNQKPTSNLHRNNPGRMVWSSRQISINDQDKITPKTSFKLTDPIFGRLYLIQSLGNTPVYRKGENAKPEENYEFRYVYRVFIDGKEKIDKFGVFVSSKLNGKDGETWTTFQLAPNPVPFDHVFRDEAEAWGRITRNLPPGTHTVRFELWGEQGQLRTRGPISVGEFSLIVSQGERAAAGMKFPDDRYTTGDLNIVRAEMLKALIGPVAKTRNEILKVSVTSDWRPGVYTDTKKLYRKISGTVLWHDKNNDSICRFTTYNFISDNLGGNNWTSVRYKSFATGSLEGDTECP